MEKVLSVNDREVLRAPVAPRERYIRSVGNNSQTSCEVVMRNVVNLSPLLCKHTSCLEFSKMQNRLSINIHITSLSLLNFTWNRIEKHLIRNYCSHLTKMQIFYLWSVFLDPNFSANCARLQRQMWEQGPLVDFVPGLTCHSWSGNASIFWRSSGASSTGIHWVFVSSKSHCKMRKKTCVLK